MADIAATARPRIEVVLGLLCVALGGLVAYQLWRAPLAPGGAAGEAAATHRSAPAPRSDVGMPPLEAFGDFVARPLFTPTRRPAPPAPVMAPEPPPVAAPAPQPPALNQVILVGVTITPEGRSALVRTAGTPKPVRVHEGDVLQGWTVKRIQPDAVSFAWASSQIDVKFPVGSPQAASARPMVPPGQIPIGAPLATPPLRRDGPVAMPSSAMPSVGTMPAGAVPSPMPMPMPLAPPPVGRN
jgi:general secretion pathway protein N